VPADLSLVDARNESMEKSAEMETQTQGRPSDLRVLPSHEAKRGVAPRTYRPYRVRDETYMWAMQADHAEVSSAALMMLGRAWMPASLIAMTKGDLAAVDERLSDGLVGETSRPMRKADVM
jgi:hypothetical protein